MYCKRALFRLFFPTHLTVYFFLFSSRAICVAHLKLILTLHFEFNSYILWVETEVDHTRPRHIRCQINSKFNARLISLFTLWVKENLFVVYALSTLLFPSAIDAHHCKQRNKQTMKKICLYPFIRWIGYSIANVEEHLSYFRHKLPRCTWIPITQNASLVYRYRISVIVLRILPSKQKGARIIK